MAWTKPEYTRGQIDRAGEILIRQGASDTEIEAAMAVLNNWRASHAFPLNTIQMWLRGHARYVDSDALMAQRLKRTPSILKKLRRFSTMKLSQVQDLGGCRAVLRTLADAKAVRDRMQKSRSKHKLVNQKDYVANPQESGYRSYHMIYKYQTENEQDYNRHLSSDSLSFATCLGDCRRSRRPLLRRRFEVRARR